MKHAIAYAVKFWTDFFDLKSDKFPPYDILSKAGNLLCFNALTNIFKNHWTFTFYRNKKTQKTRKPLICLQKLLKVVSGYTKIGADTNEYLDYKN